jgi:hypothetical protein
MKAGSMILQCPSNHLSASDRVREMPGGGKKNLAATIPPRWRKDATFNRRSKTWLSLPSGFSGEKVLDS